MVANRTINLNMYTAALTVARHYKEGNLNWPMIIYIGLAHVAALVGLLSLPQCNKWTLLWAFVLWPITGFGITGGVSENSKTASSVCYIDVRRARPFVDDPCCALLTNMITFPLILLSTHQLHHSSLTLACLPGTSVCL